MYTALDWALISRSNQTATVTALSLSSNYSQRQAISSLECSTINGGNHSRRQMTIVAGTSNRVCKYCGGKMAHGLFGECKCSVLGSELGLRVNREVTFMKKGASWYQGVTQITNCQNLSQCVSSFGSFRSKSWIKDSSTSSSSVSWSREPSREEGMWNNNGKPTEGGNKHVTTVSNWSSSPLGTPSQESTTPQSYHPWGAMGSEVSIHSLPSLTGWGIPLEH